MQRKAAGWEMGSDGFVAIYFQNRWFMTIQQFNAATYYVKRTMINFHGVFLMRTESNVWLYELDGFYVEVCYANQADNHPTIRSCLVDALDKYLPQIDISTILRLL